MHLMREPFRLVWNLETSQETEKFLKWSYEAMTSDIPALVRSSQD